MRAALPGPGRAFTRPSAHVRKGNLVLDVVFIVGILALVALVAAVGKGVERL